MDSSERINELPSKIIETDRRTLSVMNFRHALINSLMNSVSSSLSVYHGPPVIAEEGSRCASMYSFLVGNWKASEWRDITGECIDLP